MFLSLDKTLHFLGGLVVGVGFWWILERKAVGGYRCINPICYLVMVIWGASGLFLFRKMNIPILSHQLFYMAIPDWDIPLYQWTRLRFLIHRSWLFHSTIISTSILTIYFFAAIKKLTFPTSWQSKLLNRLRDCAIGLSVGICAHLIWDAALSSTRQEFKIYGWSPFHSLIWLIVNLLIGFGLPLLVTKLLDASSNYRNDEYFVE